MANGQWAVVLRHVQRLFHGGSVSGLTEGQLLDRFVATRDEVAFGAIVARHGPMVLGVCRGVLDDPHDVEDAFQATFLVLVRKAKGLRDRDLLGQWLYGVARKVALRARSDASKRRAKERPEVDAEGDQSTTLDAELRELQVLIREEVDRLPSDARMAVVLCYLEGLTHEEAADRLGWPVGTVKGRLARAREKLRERLSRRGVALPAGALSATLARGASANVPIELIRTTTVAAIQVATGKTLMAGIVSAHAITLMEGVIGVMFTSKLKLSAMALVATCAVAVPGVLAVQGQGSGNGVGNSPDAIQKKSSEVKSARGLPVADQDQSKDASERDQLIRLSENALESLEEMGTRGTVASLDVVYIWSRRLAEAKTGPSVPERERKAVLQAHFDRMQAQLAIARSRKDSARASLVDVLEAEFRVIEAGRWLRDGRMASVGDVGPAGLGSRMMGGGLAPGGMAGMAPAFGGRMGMMPGMLPGGRGGVPEPLTPAGRQILNFLNLNQTPEDEKRNDAIREMLDRKIAMNFPNPTPFEDFKRYVEVSSQDEPAGFPSGLPIYVDPDGLKEAEATMASTIMLNLEGIPLRTTLKLALRQIGLDYRIDGGVILISDQGSIVAQEMRASRLGVPEKVNAGKP